MKNRHTKQEKIEGIQNIFEARGDFNREIIPYGDKWTMPDKNYRYRQPWQERIETGFFRFWMAILGVVLTKCLFGARVVGRENLKKIKKKGFIAVSNHVHYLDTLFVRQAVGNFNSFHTMGPFNNKKGLGGQIIRHGGMWPFSADLNAMRNLNNEMERQLKGGKRVVFYPEYAMWWNYQKPRPMKEGAFHYAVKFDVPVLPIFYTFQKNKKGRMKKLRINILPAIFPDQSLPAKAAARQMRIRAEEEWKECYEKNYNKPLVYLTKKDLNLRK